MVVYLSGAGGELRVGSAAGQALFLDVMAQESKFDDNGRDAAAAQDAEAAGARRMDEKLAGWTSNKPNTDSHV